LAYWLIDRIGNPQYNRSTLHAMGSERRTLCTNKLF